MLEIKSSLFAIIFAITFATDSKKKRPENQVLFLGQEFAWPCEIKNDLFPANSNPSTRIVWTNEELHTDSIYVEGKVIDVLKDKFDVIVKDSREGYTRRDLKFRNVSFDEADLYYCITGHVTKRGFSANVIVTDPKRTSCKIFPYYFGKTNVVSVKQGDSFMVTCRVVYRTRANCKVEGFWSGAHGETSRSNVTSEGFEAVIDVDENFKNSSSFNLSLKFVCQGPQNGADFSSVEPIFETRYATPTYYFEAPSTLPERTTTPSTTSAPVTPHSGASEFNPPVKTPESQSSTMIYVFSGILAFFAILVIILVSLFLVKHRRRSDDDALTMYTRGQSMMTENVAYRRQPVSCENSYNLQQQQQQASAKLTPPPLHPAQVSLAYQGALSPLGPLSAAPLLGHHQGFQPFHHSATTPRPSVSAREEGFEVYDRIDDRGIVPSIYMEGTNKPHFPAVPPPSSASISCSASAASAAAAAASASASSSHLFSNFAKGGGSIGYLPMTPGRLTGGPRGHPGVPSSPPTNGPDVGVYLVPQDENEAV